MIDSDVHISQKRTIMTQRCSVLVKAYWASKVENRNLRSAFYPSISSSWCRNSFPCLRTYSFMNASFLWGWRRGFCWCSMSSGCFVVLTPEVKVNPLEVILNKRGKEIGDRYHSSLTSHWYNFMCVQCRFSKDPQWTKPQLSTLLALLLLYPLVVYLSLSQFPSSSLPKTCLDPKSSLTWILPTYSINKLTLYPKIPEQLGKWTLGFCFK